MPRYLFQETDDTFYITDSEGVGFAEMFSLAQRKWLGIRMDELHLTPCYEQTQCFGHDLHDSNDYTKAIEIKALPEYFRRIAAET